MHAIDLGKLDGVQEIYRNELENWLVDKSDSDSESDGDETEDEEDEDEDMTEGNSGVPLPPPPTQPKTASQTPSNTISQENPEEEEQPETPITDNRPHPRPFETLRDFFVRTSDAWQVLLLERLRNRDGDINQSIKEIRRIAFEMAEAKWWDCREEITAEEDRQEEAGIGEVVSIAEIRTEGGHGDRRR